MKKILIFIPSMMFLIGCGGGSSSSGSNSTYAGPMAVAEIYTMYTGDSVIKDSDSPLMKTLASLFAILGRLLTIFFIDGELHIIFLEILEDISSLKY